MGEESEMITLCIADDCPHRGRHEQHIDDYAVAAAREWFAETQAALTKHKADYPDMLTVWTGGQVALDRAVSKLAEIIRSHVEEYKYQHSWQCSDIECCPAAKG